MSRSELFRPVQIDAAVTNSITKRGILSLVGTGIQGLVRFLATLLTGRIAGREVQGQMNTAVSQANLMSTIWPMSLGQAASKYISRYRGAGEAAQAKAVARHLGWRTVQSAGVLAVLGAVSWVLIYRTSWLEGLVIAALVLGLAGYNFTRGVHFAVGQVHRGTVWDIITSLAGILALVVALIFGVRSIYLALPIAGSWLAYTAACWPYGVGTTPGQVRLEPKLRREMDLFITIGSLGSLASLGMLQFSTLMIKKLAGNHAAGGYNAAVVFVTPMAMIATSISMVLYPSMSEAFGRGDEAAIRRQTDMTTRGLVVVMILLFGLVATCNRPIMLIMGKSYSDVSILIPIFCLASLIPNLAQPAVNSLTSRLPKHQLFVLAASFIGLVCALIYWAIFARNGDPLHVVIGYAIGMIVLATIDFSLAWWFEKQHWWGLTFRIVGGCLLAAACITAARWLSHNPWTDLAAAVVFATVWSLANFSLVKRLIARVFTRVRTKH